MQSGNAGDGAAYHRLLREIAPVVRATAERELTRVELLTVDREAIVEQILLAAHLKRHTWEASAPLCSWLFAIIRNKLLNVMRRTGKPCRINIDCFGDELPEERPLSRVRPRK